MKLAELKVEEFTTPSPQSVHVTASLSEVWDLMTNEGIRHMLVRDDEGQVCGLLSERDVRTYSQAEDFEEIEAKDVMATDLFMATPDTKLYEVALEMSKNKFGCTVITDEDTGFIGIFTATDALNALVEVLRGDL
ncbi:MAG: CBS domain-containing protein [Bdellovibrionales bacterium]|nr:CBS domain-containing protein [Bdellovibrionales bacterium]